MPHVVYEGLRLLYLTALIAACGYALLRGGRDERWCATVQILASFASLPAVWVQGAAGWHGTQYAVLGVDLAALAAFVSLAMRSDRFWPLWVAGFHLDAVLTHLAKLIAPTAVPAGYALLQGFWAYPLMAALAIGTYSHSRSAQHERNGS